MSGRLTGIGVGPGDPELLTLKGLSRLRGADVVAYPVLGGHESFTRRVVSDYLREGQRELPLEIPLIVSDAEQPLALVSEDSLTSHDVGSSERCQLMPAGAARKKINGRTTCRWFVCPLSVP